MKRCPHCAEEIQDAAVLCRFCNRELPATEVQAPEPVQAPRPSQDRVASGVTSQNSKTQWGISSGKTLRNSLITGLVGLVLAFWPTTFALGFLVIWVAASLFLRGPIVPRILISMLVAAIVGAFVGTPKSTSSGSAPQNVAQPPNLLDLERQMQAAIEGKKWSQAASVANSIRQQDPSNAAARGTAQAIAAGIEEERATRGEEARRKSVATGLAEAKRVVSDPKLCDTPKAIADAWTNLKATRRQDPEWEQATGMVRQLERCRAAAERTMSQGLRQVMVTQRKEWASTYERGLLDKGIDARVTLSGTSNDQVRIQWILINRASTHQITNGGSMAEGSFLQTLQRIGFRRVTFADGYDDAWSYTLEPANEANGGSMALAGMGIGQPLSLSQERR